MSRAYGRGSPCNPRLHPRQEYLRRALRLALGYGWLFALSGLWCAVLVLLTHGEAVAQELREPSPAHESRAAPKTASNTPTRILDIQIEGNVLTSDGELLGRLISEVNEPFQVGWITQDVRALYALGAFRHVQAFVRKVPARGYLLIYRVQEHPRIRELRISGNSVLEQKTLDAALELKIGQVYTSSLRQRIIRRLRKAYRQQGYMQTRVIVDTEALSPLQIRLSVRIQANPRLYLTKIRTQGNHVFTDLEILRKFQSAQVDCFSWATSSGVLDETRINADLQQLTSGYLAQGYIRLHIARPKITIIHGRRSSRALVALQITEGAQYFVRQLNLEGDILGDQKRLLDRLALESEEVYDPQKLRRDVFRIQEMYREQGYAFVRVIPQVRIDDVAKRVDVTLSIAKGEKAYIGRILFYGNEKTRDPVLRREFSLRENELYNGTELRRSRAQLLRLGFFKPTLRVDTQTREDEDNVLDVHTYLEKGQTGSLQGQLGYGEVSGLGAAIVYSEGNLFGRGQTLRLTLKGGQRNVSREISLDFIEPHLLDSDYSSTSNLSYSRAEETVELKRGVYSDSYYAQNFGHPLISPWRISVGLNRLTRNFKNYPKDFLRLNTATLALRYDTVNHPIFPTQGRLASLSIARTGWGPLGGTHAYDRYRLRAQQFFSLDSQGKFVFLLKGRLGWLRNRSAQRVPSSERFRLGGLRTLRGHSVLSIGGVYGARQQNMNDKRIQKRDARTGELLTKDGSPVYEQADARTVGLQAEEYLSLQGGGIFERLFNAELLFPLTGEAIRGVVFFDAGQVNSEKAMYSLLQTEEPGFWDLLRSLGAGVRLITPLGVMRFEYGIKLNADPREKEDRVDFSIGTLF